MPVRMDKKVGEPLENLAESHQHLLIKKGLTDEKITAMKAQVTYGGCDTRDVYYHGWDVSIMKTPPRDKERQYQIERAFLLDKTFRKAEKLIGNKTRSKSVYGVTYDKYISPEQISRRFAKKIREDKAREVPTIYKDLYEKLKPNMRDASP